MVSLPAARRPSGPLLILAAAALWSTAGAAIKLCSLNAWQISLGRSVVAAGVLWLLLPGARARPSRGTWAVAAAYAVTVVLFTVANKLTTSANAIFLQDTAPLYVLLLSPLLLARAPLTLGAVVGSPLPAGPRPLLPGQADAGPAVGKPGGAGQRRLLRPGHSGAAATGRQQRPGARPGEPAGHGGLAAGCTRRSRPHPDGLWPSSSSSVSSNWASPTPSSRAGCGTRRPPRPRCWRSWNPSSTRCGRSF